MVREQDHPLGDADEGPRSGARARARKAVIALALLGAAATVVKELLDW